MKPNCFSDRNSLLMPQEFNKHLLLRLDSGFTFTSIAFLYHTGQSVYFQVLCGIP